MSLTLFNRYGIRPSLKKIFPPGPVPDFLFDANTLGLANGTAVSSVSIGGAGPYTLGVPATNTAPSYVTGGINGHPSLLFDNMDYLESGTYVTEMLNSNYSIYCVVATNSTTGGDQLLRVDDPFGTTTDGSIISRGIFNGQEGRLSIEANGANASIVIQPPMAPSKQYIISIRTDINVRLNFDVMSLEIPTVRQQGVDSGGTPPYYQFINNGPKVAFAGSSNYPNTAIVNPVYFGEFRMFTRYLTDTEHEDTMQELASKWR